MPARPFYPPQTCKGCAPAVLAPAGHPLTWKISTKATYNCAHVVNPGLERFIQVLPKTFTEGEAQPALAGTENNVDKALNRTRNAGAKPDAPYLGCLWANGMLELCKGCDDYAEALWHA
eukprot:scaffold221034_cov43-Prasinocladus_malaysianus.AAC.1